MLNRQNCSGGRPEIQNLSPSEVIFMQGNEVKLVSVTTLHDFSLKYFTINHMLYNSEIINKIQISVIM